MVSIGSQHLERLKWCPAVCGMCFYSVIVDGGVFPHQENEHLGTNR